MNKTGELRLGSKRKYFFSWNLIDKLEVVRRNLKNHRQRKVQVQRSWGNQCTSEEEISRSQNMLDSIPSTMESHWRLLNKEDMIQIILQKITDHPEGKGTQSEGKGSDNLHYTVVRDRLTLMDTQKKKQTFKTEPWAFLSYMHKLHWIEHGSRSKLV